MKLINNIKYKLNELSYLRILFSPFKPFKLKWYIGKTAIGVPYFLPRKWVKAKPEWAHKAAQEEIDKLNKWNERNPDCKRKIRPYNDYYNEYLRYLFPVPLKVGFSSCGLGWKTKWSDTDYRYEWSPVLSFVFFGYQIAVSVVHEHAAHYWTSWLYYDRFTDKSKSWKERIKQCRKEFPQVWTVHSTGKEPETIDYYNLIIKKKYL